MTILAWAGSAGAAEVTTEYALKIRGFTVGQVELRHRTDAQRYLVAGLIRNTGVTRLFRQFSFRGSAQGRVRGARLLPERYQEAADTGSRQSEALITYRGGVPRVDRYASPVPPAEDAPDPATQGGTLDPLSAIHALLRDVPRGRACRLDVAIYDGRRRSRIAMRPAGEAEGVPVCRGSYERLQGFTPEEVARHRRFDFVLNYSDAGEGILRVEKVAFDSSYGTATIDRR